MPQPKPTPKLAPIVAAVSASKYVTPEGESPEDTYFYYRGTSASELKKVFEGGELGADWGLDFGYSSDFADGYAGGGAGAVMVADRRTDGAGRWIIPDPSDVVALLEPHTGRILWEKGSGFKDKELEQRIGFDERRKTGERRQRRFSIVMVGVSDAAGPILKAGQQIPKEELGSDGYEKDPHITIKYGAEDDLDILQNTIKGATPFRVTLGKTKVFIPTESSDGQAPIVVEAHAPELKRLHELVDKAMSVRPDDFPYNPHVTLAYVKPEFAQKYEDSDICEGITFQVKSVIFSRRDRSKIEVPLEQGKAVVAAYKFIPQVRSKDEALISVDVQKFEEAWKKDQGYYVGPGGSDNAIGGRYERFQKWLVDNPGKSIEAPIVSWNEVTDCPSFTDGRHRFAVLRDLGESKVFISVPKEQVRLFQKFARKPDWLLGDCASYAVALQRAMGGELYVLMREGKGLHVFVRKDGKSFDAKGQRGTYSMALDMVGSADGVSVTGPFTADNLPVNLAQPKEKLVQQAEAQIHKTSSHKTPPLSDTQYENPEMGEETNAYAVVPERVKGTREEPALETLAPQLFKTALIMDDEKNEGLQYVGADEEDAGELSDQAYQLARKTVVNILSDKEPSLYALFDGMVVGALFISTGKDHFSFDVVVDPEFQGSGIGSHLVTDAENEFQIRRDAFGDDYQMQIDVINPKMKSLLENRGYQVTKDMGGRWMMTKKASVSILYQGMTVDGARKIHASGTAEGGTIDKTAAAFQGMDLATGLAQFAIVSIGRDKQVLGYEIYDNHGDDYVEPRLTDKFAKGKTTGEVYLLHFNIRPDEVVQPTREDARKPFHARHYLGWAENAQSRIQEHREGTGARLTQHLKSLGYTFEVAQIWNGESRKFERRLKDQGGLSRHCPICQRLGIDRESIAKISAGPEWRRWMIVNGEVVIGTKGELHWQIAERYGLPSFGYAYDLVQRGSAEINPADRTLTLRGYKNQFPPNSVVEAFEHKWPGYKMQEFALAMASKTAAPHTILALTPEARQLILQKFPPKFPEVKADHVTLQYGVPANVAPPAAATVVVVGYASDDSLEALAVTVDGVLKRPDGKPYHITLSLDRSKGRTPADSGTLLAQGFEDIQPFDVQTQPQVKTAARLYNGGSGKPGRFVTYFTPNKEMAESYVEMYNDRYGQGGQLNESDIHFSNPAPWEVIMEIADSIGLDNESYTPASIFDEQLHGARLISQLIAKLKGMGYDGAILDDIAYGKQIQDKAWIKFSSSANDLTSEEQKVALAKLETLQADMDSDYAEAYRQPAVKLQDLGMVNDGWTYKQHPASDEKAGRLATIPLAGIGFSHSAQDATSLAGLKAYILRQPDPKRDGWPEVGRTPDGKYHVVSGHTRLGAVLLSGRGTAKAKVFQYDQEGNLLRKKIAKGDNSKITPQILEQAGELAREKLFPDRDAQNGDCEPVSDEIYDILKARGFDPWINYGTYRGEPHTWIMTGDLYVDASHDQFMQEDVNAYVPIRVGRTSDADYKADYNTGGHRTYASLSKYAFQIEVPKNVRSHFWEEPPEGNLEFWAYRHATNVLPGEKIVFTFDGAPVASVVCHHTEAPGQSKCENTGKYEKHHKVYWDPKKFKRLDGKTAAPAAPMTLHQALESLRPQIVAVAQKVYDENVAANIEDPEFEHGICDEIAQEIQGVIVSHVADVEVRDGGQDGDDHAWVIAFNDHEAHGVDIPPRAYESGGGYSWTLHENVKFKPEDVEIWSIDIPTEDLRTAKVASEVLAVNGILVNERHEYDTPVFVKGLIVLQGVDLPFTKVEFEQRNIKVENGNGIGITGKGADARDLSYLA